MVSLIGGGNSEGYSIALMKSFSQAGASKTPNKSSLCRARQKVSYLFFADQLTQLLKKFEMIRTEYLGLRIYAIDGQMLILPKSNDIIKAGYNGRAISKIRDTYYPRGYLTHAYDVLSGVTKAFVFGPRLHEQADARSMVKGFEKNSLTLYDRLYFNLKLIKIHYQIGNYFLFRCKKNACLEVKEFYDSSEKLKTIFYGDETEKFEIHLIKIRNPKTGESALFATNLPLALVRDNMIRKLYRLRWEVETSFKELTAITQAEQWHSKSVNGILQELYCRFWLINYTKIQTFTRVAKPHNPLQDEYKKPNFKLIYNWIIFHFPKLFQRKSRLWRELDTVTKRSMERRTHGKRSYRRELKRPASPYPYSNTQYFWDR